jgi:CRISPR/Cas system CSM-associated protein Csm4 (group 5 of RAMP superfamily)
MPVITAGDLSSLLLRRPGEQTPNASWLLSLFHPATSDSVDWQQGDYQLTTRGGRIESSAGWGEPKKLTRMVAEGSVLVAGAAPLGSAPDVAPDGFSHPVYRSGFALTLPISLVPVPKVTA